MCAYTEVYCLTNICEPCTQKDLALAIQDVNDFAALLSPGLITEKNKFHILAHLPFHVERFGPPLLFSTERYESFNHIFRLCSIHSNRQAPSRDIAAAFANQERVRHMVSGGYWWDKKTSAWVQAGEGVLQHMARNTVDARLLGIQHTELPTPLGKMTLQPLPPPTVGQPRGQRPPPLAWAQTQASNLCPTEPARSGQWYPAASVTTQTGDTAVIASEVIVRSHVSVSIPGTVASIELRAPGPWIL